MKIKNSSLKQYLYRIFRTIFLTELIALLLITQNLKLWLGYFLGSLAGCVNFYFQAKGTENSLNLPESNARLGTFKNFYLRYLILALVVVIFVKFIKVNIFSLLVGLIAVPLIVGLDSLFSYRKGKREF